MISITTVFYFSVIFNFLSNMNTNNYIIFLLRALFLNSVYNIIPYTARYSHYSFLMILYFNCVFFIFVIFTIY